MEIFNQISEVWYSFINSNLELITLTVILFLLTGVVIKVLKQDREIKNLNEITEDLWIALAASQLEKAEHCLIFKKKRIVKKKQYGRNQTN